MIAFYIYSDSLDLHSIMNNCWMIALSHFEVFTFLADCEGRFKLWGSQRCEDDICLMTLTSSVFDSVNEFHLFFTTLQNCKNHERSAYNNQEKCGTGGASGSSMQSTMTKAIYLDCKMLSEWLEIYILTITKIHLTAWSWCWLETLNDNFF